MGRPGGLYYRIDQNDLANMRDALARGFPLYVASEVHVGWFRQFLADTDGSIDRRPDDAMKGGHAYVIVGYDEEGFWLHNSWGEQWGVDGYARIPYGEWEQLGYEVWVVIPPAS